MQVGVTRAGHVMAAGTVVSRLTGFLRSILLVAALGNALHADLFAVANTVPTALVILLGAGVFNAVLVPQVVQADQRGEGEAYVNQVVTVFGAVLLLGTVALTAAAPWVMRIFLAPGLGEPAFTEHRESAIALAVLCLPQVFFYGMFALVGQVLHARGVFGPVMWAPVANNVVASGVLLAYLVAYGPAADPCGAYLVGQERVLGLGATAGVVVQLLVLAPYLRRAGIRIRPTRAVLTPGVRRTIRLGGWTVATVLVNQVAYAAVVRLATEGTIAATACVTGSSSGTGYTVYSSAFLLIMAPHAVATVSIMTATLPGLARIAGSGELPEVGRRLGGSLRTVLTIIVPTVALLELLTAPVAELVWGYGAAAGSADQFGPTLACFGIALVFFTAHYVAVRGLFALQANGTVLAVQCVVAAVNVSLALALTSVARPAQVAPALAVAYAASYAVGSVLAWLAVRRRLGSVDGRRTATVVARVVVSTVLASGCCAGAFAALTGGPLARVGSKADALLAGAGVAAFFALAFAAFATWTGVLDRTRLRAALRR